MQQRAAALGCHLTLAACLTWLFACTGSSPPAAPAAAARIPVADQPQEPLAGSEAAEPAAGADGSSQGAGPTADFAERCRAPGVLVCRGFDNDSELTPTGGAGTDTNFEGSRKRTTIDTTHKKSGAGSLRSAGDACGATGCAIGPTR